MRIAIIQLLDEFALPLQTGSLQQYLAVPHLQDFKGQLQWQGLHAYAKALAVAYAASLAELRPVMPHVAECAEQLALYLVCWLRVLGEQVEAGADVLSRCCR